jgi:signal transduction histidine kinase
MQKPVLPDSCLRLLFYCYKAPVCLVISICLLTAVASQSQSLDNSQYRISHFTDEDGLPQNSIKAIVPDKNGFIWLATEFGLVRFDGAGFHAFRTSNGSLLTNRLVYILPSGIPDKPIVVTGNREVLWVNETAAIVTDPSIKNNIYLKGHLGSNKIYSSIGLPNLYHNKVQEYYYGIPLDTATYYLISRDSILFFSDHHLQYSRPFTGKNSLNFFESASQLYYWEGKGQPLLFKKDSVKAVKVTGDILTNTAYKSGKGAAKVFWNINTRQLFLLVGSSLYFFKQLPDGSFHTKCILAGFDMEENEIISIFYDEPARRVFLGSYTRGLFVVRQHDFELVHSAGTGDDNYYAQALYDSNKIVTPRGNVMGPSYTRKKLPVFRTLTTEDQYSILTAADKSIWVKFKESVYHLNKAGTAILHYWRMDEEVTQLYEDLEGRVLVALRRGGLYYIKPGMKVPELLLKGKWNISYIQQQDADVLWVGTEEGCYKFHLSTRTMDTIPGLKGKYIRSLLVRDPREIWITTYEDGFFLYDGNTLFKLPLDKGGYLQTVHCILEDKHGFFWITTNKGLFQAARQDLLNYAYRRQKRVFYQYYEKSSGFGSNEFNGGCEPCGVKLANGYFSFPSLNGLVWFKPDSVQADLPDKGLFVDKIEVNLEARKAIDTIKLDDSAKRIKFFVTTPYFGNNYNLSIEYTLLQNNQDSTWLPLDADRSITLSALTSGTYQLLIRKLSGFGKNNYAYRSITLVVPPFFYEKAWFRILMLLACVLLVWGYGAFRLRYIRHKNKMLEVRIADRTRELEQTLLALQDSEHDLRRQTRIQDRLITAMAHDIKSPLKFMADSAKRMAGRLTQSGLEKEQEEAQVLSDSGTRVYYYTENLLQYIRSQTRHNKVVMKPVNLSQLVQEKIGIFQTIAAEQQTEIVNGLPADLIINSNANLLGVIIHNLLDNAVKITIEGKITVEAHILGQQCVLSVKDSGFGMRPALMDWCNQHNGEDTMEQERMPGHTGMGLLIVKDLLVLINARLFVQPNAEKGTEVLVIIKDALV